MNGVGLNRKTLCNMARFAFEVVNDLLSRDQHHARNLRSSETGSRQIVGEETITVELASKLLSRFPQHVEVTLFTHNEEAQTGADWYWRVERGEQTIHACVQAKRVQRRQFGESDALGYIDIDLPQLDRLVQATHTATQRIIGLEAWLATYARFSATPPCGYDNLQSCWQHRHTDECKNEQPSLWIANAQEIANTRMQQASIEQIVQHSIRLDCVLPCIDTSKASGPARKGFVLQSGLQSYKECVAIIESDPQLRSEFKGALRIHY